MHFEVGDRVTLSPDCPDYPTGQRGCQGTIKGYEYNCPGARCAVEFDTLTTGHECNTFTEDGFSGRPVALCKPKKGWWVYPQWLIPSSPLWNACSKYINKELQS